MSVSIEEAKAFITDARKYRQTWLVAAERSWNELKRRYWNGKPWAYPSTAGNSQKVRGRYPAWYSIFKIRQPLLLARVGIPIGKDTTQDGNDNIGATAAICYERLVTNLARNFDFFDVMAACRDDFLATNFATCRAYYERDEVKEHVKEYITPQPDPMNPNSMIFVDSAGQEVKTDEVYQDDEGYYIEHEQTIDVENESVCLEPILYKTIYIDPDIRRWKRCKRLAFEEMYSEPEFKEMFGRKAFDDLARNIEQNPGADEAAPKRQYIKVFEYWDAYEKECYWFAEHGSDFIKPLGYAVPDNEEHLEPGEYLNGLYNLERFFPVPEPLIMNAPTDEFWPVPEYLQMIEIFEDIHTIFSRMVVTTRAYRARLLFDSGVDGLQPALNEATEGDAFGIPNLANALQSGGGNLSSFVQYIPVEGIIASLEQLYQSLEQRLRTVYRLTGTSDLLQGQSQDNSGKTLGERQMEEKYATNQLYEAQRKMAEFVRASYQLIGEMALKNFKDASLDMYIMPQTLEGDHQQRYRAALGMLKENQKRFRIELETDSTIALNEEYDKRMRVELANTLTAALEKVSNIAQASPALVVPELHTLKFLIQGFRQGKMFQNEVTQAIDNVVKQFESAPPAFNKDEEALKLKKLEIETNAQLKQLQMAADERLQSITLAQQQQMAIIKGQVDQFKAQVEAGTHNNEMAFKYQELQSQIADTQQELALKHDALLVELQKIATQKDVATFSATIDQQLEPYRMQLEQQKLALDAAELQLRQQDQALKAQEQQMVDTHVTTDNILQKMRLELDAATLKAEMSKPPELPPITIHMPAPTASKKKLEIKRDAEGNMTHLVQSDVQEPTAGE